MTTVNMDEPLPAIQDAERSHWEARAWLHFVTFDEPMTLSHLVQVLAALTGEQRDAVMIETLNRCPVERGQRRVRLAMAMHAGPSAYGELYAQVAEEKARADRAEQALASLRITLDGTMAAHEEQAKLAHSRGCEIERAWEAASKAGLPYAESLASLVEDMARKLKETEE